MSIHKYLLIHTILIITFLTCIQKNHTEEASSIDYSVYAELLKTYVDNNGLVDYKGLKADQSKLDSFLQDMNAVKESDFKQWEEKDQIAYWINAYNAFTLKAIIDHYPIKAGWLTSLTYPKNSIRQISGVWDNLTFGALGKPITLNAIEHEILRVKFNEPRIHVAIVCASIGCPPLRNEPFTGKKLNQQLADQSQKFTANPHNFRIDRENGRVYLSAIFNWFGEDFIMAYNTDSKFKFLSEQERSVMNYVYQYLSEMDQKYLDNNMFNVSYRSYDWTLNEQP